MGGARRRARAPACRGSGDRGAREGCFRRASGLGRFRGNLVAKRVVEAAPVDHRLDATRRERDRDLQALAYGARDVEGERAAGPHSLERVTAEAALCSCPRPRVLGRFAACGRSTSAKPCSQAARRGARRKATPRAARGRGKWHAWKRVLGGRTLGRLCGEPVRRRTTWPISTMVLGGSGTTLSQVQDSVRDLGRRRDRRDHDRAVAAT